MDDPLLEAFNAEPENVEYAVAEPIVARTATTEIFMVTIFF